MKNNVKLIVLDITIKNIPDNMLFQHNTQK